MRNPIKCIIGPVYLLLGSLWARITRPRNMNRQGFFDSCPVDGKGCKDARAGECTNQECTVWKARRR